MNELIQAFGNYSLESVIILVIAIIILGKATHKLYKAAGELHEKTEEYESIVNLTYENSKNIEKLSKIIDEEKDMTNEYRRRTLSDSLFKCYHNVKEKGYISRRQLENFQANVDLYKKLNGNGIVENKYIPEIMAMEIKD